MRGLVGGPSLEVRLQTHDGKRGQSSGSGPIADPNSGLVLDGPQESCGLAPQWALGPSDASGPFSPTSSPCDSGPSHLGLSLDDGRTSKKLIGGAGLGVRGPDLSLIFNVDDAHLRGARPLNGAGPSSVEGLDQSWSFLLVTDGLWRPSAEEQSLEENSKTNDALIEEALRYGNASNFFGPLVCVSPSPHLLFLVGLHWRSITTVLGWFWTHPRGNLWTGG